MYDYVNFFENHPICMPQPHSPPTHPRVVGAKRHHVPFRKHT